MTHRGTDPAPDLWEPGSRPGTTPGDEPTALAEVRASSHVRALSDLFGRRPDLAGVYKPADLATEAVRWSA